MKSTISILGAAALILGASAAQAARPMGQGAAMSNRNIIIAPTPPMQSSIPQTNSGALELPQPLGTPPVNAGALGITNPAALGVPGQQSFGALPGNPGSATYDPNAALPSLGNQGTPIAPTPGTTESGIDVPSTSSGM